MNAVMPARRRAVAIAGVLLLVAAAAAWLLTSRQAPPVAETGVAVAGGDGGGLPRATPAEEQIDAGALQSALDEARRQDARVFLVMRHGHLVLEHYAADGDANALLDAGGFAQVLAAVGAGIAQADGMLRLADTERFDARAMADAVAKGSGQPYADFISQRIWQPMNAAAARLIDPAGGFAARPADWLRVGEMLLNEGNFEGTSIVAGSWINYMRQPLPATPHQGFGLHLGAGAVGAEPFASNGVFYLKGKERWRLWMAPALHLTVLFAGEAAGDANEAWDETLLFNRVIRSVRAQQQPATPGSPLKQLVPGH